MELFNALDERKTIRKYTDYQPTDEEIKRIINSARLSPSAMNTQNWRFIAVFNQEVKEKMANAILNKYDEINSRVAKETAEGVNRYKAHSTFFKEAPVVIVCVETQAASFMGGVLEEAKYSKEEIALMRPDSFLLSMGGAVQSMALAAHGLGLSSCWMVAPVLAEEEYKKILGLKAEDKIVTLLTIGQPFGQNSNRVPKKDLNEIMEIVR